MSDYNAVDCSPPGSSVHGISRARILEWVVSISRQKGKTVSGGRRGGNSAKAKSWQERMGGRVPKRGREGQYSEIVSNRNESAHWWIPSVTYPFRHGLILDFVSGS